LEQELKAEKEIIMLKLNKENEMEYKKVNN
jgi:hypothetical protein